MLVQVLKYNADVAKQPARNRTAFDIGKSCQCRKCVCCRIYRLCCRINRKFGTMFNLLG